MRRVSAPYSKLTIVFKPGKHSLRFEMSCIAKIAASDAHAQQAIDAFLAERGGRRIISTCPCAAETRTS
jgi:hypothetical protein